jgi:O-antigen/teichoic acid export membrane protein
MSVDRSTFKHAAIYSGAAMLSRMIGFVLLPLYAHELQTIGYGIIAMVDLAVGFLLSILAQGIRGGMVRFYHEEKDPERKKDVVPTGTRLVMIATTVLVLLTMLLSRPLSALMLGDGDFWYLVCLGAGSFLLQFVGETASSILLIQRRSLSFSGVSLVQLTLGLLLNFSFIVVLQWGVTGYFLAAIGTAVVSMSIHLWLLISTCGWRYDPVVAKKLIAFQLPLVPGSLAAFFSRQAERVLLRFMDALESVGILEMGYKFPVLLTLMIHQPFMRSWDTRRVEIAEEPDGPERIGRMYTYGLFMMLAAGLVLAVCIRELLMILLPEEFWPAYRIARVEILTVLMQSSMYHFIFGIFYMKKTKDWAIVRGVTSAVKVGFSVLFISLWGLYGAAYSACITMFITLVWGTWLGMKHYYFPIEKAKVGLLLGSVIVMFYYIQGADFRSVELLDPVRTSWMPGMIDSLSGTFFGTWKEGKLITMLTDRLDLIVDMSVRGLLAALYLLMLPIVHDPSRLKIMKLLRMRVPEQA